MQVEPSTRFANRALDSGERFLRRRSLYPAELWMRMKDEGYYTLIEMKDEFSEAGEPVPIRRRPLYPAELWMQSR